MSFKWFDKKSVIINNIFNIIGDAEAAANLLWEFNIAEKNEERLTNNKKGKVILVKVIVKSNLL